jgi:hypothetical protein
MSEQNTIGIGERSDWGDFPAAICNGNLGDLKV